MKTIKIFLASSEELKEERIELADLVGHLNYMLHKQDINIVLVKWEYINQSMEPIHKQAEYNECLKECDLCMVLYWTRFGIFTKSELDTAYREHNLGNNPQKLYVYFKKDDAKLITDELKSFRDRFPKDYGHFYSEFNNADSLKTSFLLQFMDFQNTGLKDSSFMEIKDSHIYMSNIPVADLKKVAFAGNNESYKRLLSEIEKTRELLSFINVEHPKYSEYAQGLIELEKQRKELEESLWDTALTITRLSNGVMSERLQRAIDLFNKGDNKGADAILNEEQIYKDADHNLRLIELGEAGKKGLAVNIDELKLKIKTLKNEHSQGWGEKVCEIHKRIIEFSEKLYGEESKELADALAKAAEDFRIHSKYAEALDYNQRSLKIRIGNFGENHSDVATSYNNIGSIYNSQGDYGRALENYEKSLKIYRDIFGENHQYVAISYNNIGGVYYSQNDYDRALENQEKALKICLSIFSNTHPDVARSYNNIGSLYNSQGDYGRALEYFEKALKIGLGIFGEDHPDVATSYNNIGSIYSSQGDYDRALEYHEKSLKIRLGIFGEDHPDVATSYNNIGGTYYRLEDYGRALEYYEKALKILLGIFGEDHPYVATSYNNIGWVYKSQGDYGRALEYFEKTLGIRLRFFDENHQDVKEVKKYIEFIEWILAEEKQ